MLAKLMRIAEEYNVCVFITNQMMADPGATMTFVADPKKPVGGHVLAHASTTRLALRKGRNETRIAKIYDSPDLPEVHGLYIHHIYIYTPLYLYTLFCRLRLLMLSLQVVLIMPLFNQVINNVCMYIIIIIVIIVNSHNHILVQFYMLSFITL